MTSDRFGAIIAFEFMMNKKAANEYVLTAEYGQFLELYSTQDRTMFLVHVKNEKTYYGFKSEFESRKFVTYKFLKYHDSRVREIVQSSTSQV